MGVKGQSEAGRGVLGLATSGTGVFGKAAKGRGVVAAGGKAQVRLVPSASVTHPATGLAGDLFLDKSHRLWFCKGGTNWKQIA